MFGWGSVTSVLNTDKSVCAWKLSKSTGNTAFDNLRVYKSKTGANFVTPSQQDTQIIVRAVCNAAANSIVEDYIQNTREWAASAESKLATVAEYNRVSAAIQSFTTQSNARHELAENQTLNSDIVILKRHRMTDENAPPKRIKLLALDENMAEIDEMTQIQEYYTVIAGGLSKRVQQKGIVTVKAPTAFNLDMLVAAESASTTKIPEPSTMLSQPFRNSLQLKSHMTSLVQAFAAKKDSTVSEISIATDVHAVGNCYRHHSLLLNEYNLAVQTVATILTTPIKAEDESPFIIMEPGNDPIVLRKNGPNVFISPNESARVIYRMTKELREFNVVYTLEFRRPRRADQTRFQTLASIEYESGQENEHSAGILKDPAGSAATNPPFCYLFRKPQKMFANNKVYSRLSMYNLYNIDIQPTEFQIALGDSTNEQSYARSKSDKMQQQSNCWFRDFTIKPNARVVISSPDDVDGSEFAIASNVDVSNLTDAFYSVDILEPCVEAAAASQANSLTATKKTTVDNVVHFLHTAPAASNDNSFKTKCALAVKNVTSTTDEHTDEDWFVRLVPVNEEDVAWMSAHEASLCEFTFACEHDPNTTAISWFLGGTPSPTLDALESALVFLSGQCSYDVNDRAMVALLELEDPTLPANSLKAIYDDTVKSTDCEIFTSRLYKHADYVASLTDPDNKIEVLQLGFCAMLNNYDGATVDSWKSQLLYFKMMQSLLATICNSLREDTQLNDFVEAVNKTSTNILLNNMNLDPRPELVKAYRQQLTTFVFFTAGGK